MENFHIKPSTYIPRIDFDAETGVLEIAGESYHEYTTEFYQPVFEWLENYLKKSGRDITMNFRMTYFNTSSSRRFIEILTMLEDYHKGEEEKGSGGSVRVNWYFEENDVDMEESGEEYAEDVELPFELIETPLGGKEILDNREESSFGSDNSSDKDD